MTTLGAIGIVYGDIGTSPLYALNQIFHGPARLTPDHATVLGGISLVIWSLIVIVAIKYALLVLRADNDGEGGLFALYALMSGETRKHNSRALLLSLIMGAGLLFGDGIITPAISVLSAVEGLSVATPSTAPFILPIAVLLLTALFALQARGTSSVGRIFGPVLIIWFLAIAFFGLRQILAAPQILQAFNPIWAIRFLIGGNLYGDLLTLGAVMLCVTGGEAMYADLGHFGARPIRLGWFVLVFPSLICNYLGQGAFQLTHPVVAGNNLFYGMVPRAALYPMVILATLATIIASQSLISGAFSLMTQAVRLGLFPRLHIVHTHAEHTGQTYIGFINWSLYLGCIVLAVSFGSSNHLAAAYGLAVSGVMVITSLAMYPVAREHWQWSARRAALVWWPLTAFNGTFLAASSLKFLEGGYVPVSIGLVVFVIMATWQWGRQATSAAYTRKQTMNITELIELHRGSEHFVERNAILMIPRAPHKPHDHTPALLQLIWNRYGVLPRNLIFVTVNHQKTPYVHGNRYKITVFEQTPGRGSILSVNVSFGFMEEPNVENLLEEMAQLKEIALPTDRRRWIVHVAHENLFPSRAMGGVKRLRLRLFQFLRTVSQPTYYYYGMGVYVQLSAEIMPVHVR
ncbi:KUP system potassium uptake protein [Paludibacterium purpuratum]|uniref:Probable potassium transport system protein Kup n=2 Tax=Paludibacterium purpuratum TaxID=1144873 RepID=A0A4V3DV77_9NEIS|nr:KUP system potassium uptake protein [Paludibacterium purpuratum]